MKNQKGITLIALVVTIVVLLILAGVAIAMLRGDNGILTKATTAASETKIAEAREAINNAINELTTQYYDDKYISKPDTTTQTLENYVASGLKSKISSYIVVGENGYKTETAKVTIKTTPEYGSKTYIYNITGDNKGQVEEQKTAGN